MIIIVLGHIASYYASYDINSINAAPMAAYFGIEYLSPVTFFIIMSGFTLTVVYYKPTSPDYNKPLTVSSVWTFFQKRFLRLAPIYYLR
jgi:peptidoglycan/LPS O-acetylase OafA/YrhL